MAKSRKIWLIVAVVLMLLVCIVLGAVMAEAQWNFDSLLTDRYQTNEHKISNSFSSIVIVTDTANIVFLPSDDTECSVVCYEQANQRHSVALKDGALVIEVNDQRKWYEYIGIHFHAPELTVYLPRGEYGALAIKSDTGDVEIPDAFGFESVDISGDTGNVTVCASTSGKMKIKTSTGGIRVENASVGVLALSASTGGVAVSNVTCEGDVSITVSTGKTSLLNVACQDLTSVGDTGDISLKGVIASGALSIERSTGKTSLLNVVCQDLTSVGDTGDISLKGVIASGALSIERSTGDVRFEGADAAEIFVTTDTGDVKGTLLSEKIFVVKTDTGRIDVPKSVTGDRCEITTDTGDIKITIVE